MSSGDFNVTAAAALVLGGIAALLLATVIALGGYGRPADRATPASAATAPTRHGTGGALPEAEIEYLLEASEPVTGPERRAP